MMNKDESRRRDRVWVIGRERLSHWSFSHGKPNQNQAKRKTKNQNKKQTSNRTKEIQINK